jgi:hypothetical protein
MEIGIAEWRRRNIFHKPKHGGWQMKIDDARRKLKSVYPNN